MLLLSLHLHATQNESPPQAISSILGDHYNKEPEVKMLLLAKSHKKIRGQV